MTEKKPRRTPAVITPRPEPDPMTVALGDTTDASVARRDTAKTTTATRRRRHDKSDATQDQGRHDTTSATRHNVGDTTSEGERHDGDTTRPGDTESSSLPSGRDSDSGSRRDSTPADTGEATAGDGSRKLRQRSYTMPQWLFDELRGAVAATKGQPGEASSASEFVRRAIYAALLPLREKYNGGRPFPAPRKRLRSGPSAHSRGWGVERPAVRADQAVSEGGEGRG